LEPVLFSIDIAIPIGLILNELLTNSFKYAFPEQHNGTVEVCLQRLDSQQYVLSIRDDGCGFPKGFDFDNAKTLGLRLVKILTKQIGADLTFSTGNFGTEFKLSFQKK